MMTNFDKADVDQQTKSYRENFTPDVERGLVSLKAKMAKEEVNRTPSSKPLRRRWLGVAAAAALLLFAGLSYVRLNNLGGQTYVTNAETKEFVLPDGTRVLLNQYSQLAYNAAYGEVERSIELQGEAFFDVVPDQNVPFMVRQGPVELRVVGTSFNLQAKPGSDYFEVEVATGKVQLKAGMDEISVRAKERGVYKPSTGLNLMDARHLNRHAWRTKALTFEAQPFSEVVVSVMRAYNVTIQAEKNSDPRCDFPVTAAYSDEKLETILFDLERLSGGKFIQDKTTGIYQLKDWCK